MAGDMPGDLRHAFLDHGQCRNVRRDLDAGMAPEGMVRRQVGEEFAARRPEDRPDAAFCANDLLAAGVLQGSAILGTIRVPSDLAIIGYDDIDFVQSTVVPLSSVRQPAREIGATAIGVLLESFDDPAAAPRRVRFRPELVVRASTGG